MIEKLLIDAATSIAKEASRITAHGVLSTLTNVVGEISDTSKEKKLNKIREELPDAIIIKEFTEYKTKEHFTTRENIRKVSYKDSDDNTLYRVAGRIESPIHVLRLHGESQLIGTVTEIPQNMKGEFKSEISYKGKHFVNMYYKVYQEGIVRTYSFDDERLKFKWLDKAETKCEVLYNDKVILRKRLRSIIIALPEYEEICMLLVMAFLAAESPHGKDIVSKVSPGPL